MSGKQLFMEKLIRKSIYVNQRGEDWILLCAHSYQQREVWKRAFKEFKKIQNDPLFATHCSYYFTQKSITCRKRRSNDQPFWLLCAPRVITTNVYLKQHPCGQKRLAAWCGDAYYRNCVSMSNRLALIF